MKTYLTTKQKKFIYKNLDLIESFGKKYINYNWYIEENDWEENYSPDGTNAFPYSIILEESGDLIDCISKDFFEEIKTCI